MGTAIGAVLSVLTGWLVLRVSYHTRTGLSKVPWDKTRPWHYAAAALGVFAVGMVIVTGVEAGVLHKSLAASVTGSGGTGTTLGGVVGTRTASDPVRPSASPSAPSRGISAPATPAPSTVGGTPGPPASPATASPAPAPSVSVPPPGGAASPATTGESP